MKWAAAALLWALAFTGQVVPEARLRPSASAGQAGLRQSASAGQAAYFIRSLDNPRERREAQSRILDTPVHPGSVVKPLALIAALEHGIISADSGHMCRRISTVGGQKFVCAHPDLRRPLTPAEALAYSCNDFFVSLAPKLSRDALNGVRIAAGLPPIATGTPMASAIIGLEGPRTTPRALIDVIARVAGAGRDRAVPMKAQTKAVVLDGLRGAAEYGTASALKDNGVTALAKTGSVLMPNGGALGLVVVLTPADKPTHGIVVAAPGAAGLDAAAVASDVLKSREPLLSTAAKPSNALPPQPNSGTTADAPLNNGPESFIRLGRTTGERTKVERIAIDEYIAQVLAGEGQPKASDAAQEALAITARTFALANHNRHRSEGFDLCDTTHCQVVRPATAMTTRAANATRGRVLLHQGQPAFVFYSAWCGGQTELASQVWPGAVDYARKSSLQDDACDDEPAWTSEVRVADVERALRAAGHKGSRLRDIRVLARNTSDRVSRLRVDGFTPNEISGHEFRMALGRVAGWQSLKSTAFDVNRTGSGYRFRGRGFGHGVGLCVIGAGKRAARGARSDEILRFYFPGLTVGTMPAASVVVTKADVPLDGLELALPAAEEGERSALLALIRRGRDDIAKQTGVRVPTLRVTVHATVDSFGRATGQPWWVSGATNGAVIDLLPIGVLRQQGQLERTVRHEIAHALLDSALAKKPLWVREGAAAYFANPSAAPPSERVPCPSDAELLRPVSAGAQRDAYARAHACFARAIAAGRQWHEIQ
jgi:SpoIID/LytB domain protein